MSRIRCLVLRACGAAIWMGTRSHPDCRAARARPPSCGKGCIPSLLGRCRRLQSMLFDWARYLILNRGSCDEMAISEPYTWDAGAPRLAGRAASHGAARAVRSRFRLPSKSRPFGKARRISRNFVTSIGPNHPTIRRTRAKAGSATRCRFRVASGICLIATGC